MIKIGITGGIGSGKTVVTSIFECLGIPVYIADKEGNFVTNNSATIREKLIKLFGDEIYTPKGVNTSLLASYIFSNHTYTEQVNRIIHPEIERHFVEWTKKISGDICVAESAILFESGFSKHTDIHIIVLAPTELRIKRVMDRNKWSRKEVEDRINTQWSEEEKQKRCHYTIYNDEKHALIPQVQNFIQKVRKDPTVFSIRKDVDYD